MELTEVLPVSLWTPLLPHRAGRASVPFLHTFLQELPAKLPGCALMAESCPVLPPCWCHSWLLVLPKVSFHSHQCHCLASVIQSHVFHGLPAALHLLLSFPQVRKLCCAQHQGVLLPVLPGPELSTSATLGRPSKRHVLTKGTKAK